MSCFSWHTSFRGKAFVLYRIARPLFFVNIRLLSRFFPPFVRGLNPLRVFRCMLPAVLMALFTKSSAATLPVTVASAENNLKVKKEVARFVLPICCTINMNGCAAFILVTSLFVMQNGGWTLGWTTVMLWFFISIIFLEF